MTTNFSKKSVYLFTRPDGKVVEIEKPKQLNDRAVAQLADYSNSDNQKFLIIPVDDSEQRFLIICLARGLALSATEAVFDESATASLAWNVIAFTGPIVEPLKIRALVQQINPSGTNDVTFELVPVPGKNDTFYLKSQVGEYLSLVDALMAPSDIFVCALSSEERDILPRIEFTVKEIGTLNSEAETLTFQRATELLSLFAGTSPNPEKLKFNADLLTLLEQAKTSLVEDQSAMPSRAFLFRFYSLEDTLWYRNAPAKKPDPDSPPYSLPSPYATPPNASEPSITMHDLLYPAIGAGLGAAATLCFLAGPAGIVLAAGAGLAAHEYATIERLEERSKAAKERSEQLRKALLRPDPNAIYYNNMLAYLDGMHKAETVALQAASTAIVSDLEEFMREEHLNDKLETVFARIEQMQKLIIEMTSTPDQIASVYTQGFNPNWVNDFHTKSVVLNSENLGQVWELINSNEFKVFESLPSAYESKPLDLKLCYNPTSAMITIDPFCYAIAVIVNSILLYAFVCLMPEAALHPQWNPATLQLSASSFEQLPIPENLSIKQRTALNCFEYLYEQLKPSSTWMKRLDPDEGDAAKAYAGILKRLNQVSVDLTKAYKITDASLLLPTRDLFAEPYYNFQDASLQDSELEHENIVAAIIWLGLILVNYGAKYKFKVDTTKQGTSYTMSYFKFNALTTVREVAQEMLQAHQNSKQAESATNS